MKIKGFTIECEKCAETFTTNEIEPDIFKCLSMVECPFCFRRGPLNIFGCFKVIRYTEEGHPVVGFVDSEED